MIVRWMMMTMIWMDCGDVNKHCHPECVLLEDIIIMMKCDKIV